MKDNEVQDTAKAEGVLLLDNLTRLPIFHFIPILPFMALKPRLCGIWFNCWSCTYCYQIITGLVLSNALYPHVDHAFDSVENHRGIC